MVAAKTAKLQVIPNYFIFGEQSLVSLAQSLRGRDAFIVCSGLTLVLWRN